MHQLVFSGINTPDRRTKPPDVTRLLLFMAITETCKPVTFHDARFHGAFTKKPLIVWCSIRRTRGRR